MAKVFDNNFIRRGYELKHLFLNRPIRPFHLAVTISTGTIAYSLLTNNNFERGLYGCDCQLTGWHLGVLALASSVMLFLGWFIKPEWRLKQDWFAEWGLLLAVGVWLSRAIYVLISEESGLLRNPVASAFLSTAWAIGAGGAYMLERYDHVTAGGGDE